jgi:hypothetical protein
MATSDQYFKASTIAALQAAFFTQDAQGNWSPNAGLNITPITQAHPAIASSTDALGNMIPASPQTGDGVSYYVNIRTGTIITPPAGVTAVLASEAIPVTGEWE